MPDKLPKGFVPDKLPAGFVPDSAGVPDALSQARQVISGMSPSQAIIGPGGESLLQGQGKMEQLDKTLTQVPDIVGNIRKNALVAGGASFAPALIPEIGGGGVLAFLGRTLLKSGAAGAGAGAGNFAGQVLAGDDPLSRENLMETGKIAGFTSALSVPFEAVGGLAATKLGRGTINASMGAQSRDLTYANPAKALIREEIHDISTGDWGAYQEALRAGKTPSEAAQAAGGRFAAVSQRVNELTPRLGKLLNASTAQIPVHNVIDKPLEDAAIEVIQNPAMTDTEKMTAIGKLGDLQKSLKEGLGETATPAQLQTIKQAVGNRVNWGGTSAITDDVKGAYRSVYGSLKEAIHRSVPGTTELDNRLTDLLGASSDLVSQAKGEEAGKIPFSAVRIGQREIGRVLPATTAIPQAVVPTGAATISEILKAKGRGMPQASPNTPGLPFHPNEGKP